MTWQVGKGWGEGVVRRLQGLTQAAKRNEVRRYLKFVILG